MTTKFRKNRMGAYALVLALIVLLSGSVWFLSRSPLPGGAGTQTIQLTETGFSPQSSTITKGDTVVFTTTRERPFWPASDLHPTHEIYPAFDPGEPVEPDQSWSFRFDHVGVWNFHDHLYPYFRGTIEVVDTPTFASASVDTSAALSRNADEGELQSECGELADTSQSLRCWQDRIVSELRSNNLAGAFAVLSAFVEYNPSALGDCHTLSHEIGAEAYRLFNTNKDFALSPKTAYCGYGFYHGFMEDLLHTTNDMAQARAFCDYADAQLKPFIADAGGACIHGIGHGAVAETPPPALWGDAHAIVKPGLALCEHVASNQEELFRCASGAFNALEIIVDQGAYNLSARSDDPFWLCREQPEKYKRACYTQFLVSAMQIAQGDLSGTSAFIDTIKEDVYAEETLAGLAVERAREPGVQFAATLLWCRSLASRFHIPCITGFAEGFLKYGPPEREYMRARDWCAYERLSEEERRACFDRVLSLLRIFYSAEKARAICASVEQRYQWNTCRYD